MVTKRQRLKWLKKDLAEIQTTGADLPFPPSLVAGITLEQIDQVYQICGFPDDSGVICCWRAVYDRVNFSFKVDRMLGRPTDQVRWEQCRDIAQKTQRKVPEDILPQIFLLIAHAYTLHDSGQKTRKEIDEDRYWPVTIAQRVQSVANDIEAATEDLLQNYCRLEHLVEEMQSFGIVE